MMEEKHSLFVSGSDYTVRCVDVIACFHSILILASFSRVIMLTRFTGSHRF